jgi:hypothetical protein
MTQRLIQTLVGVYSFYDKQLTEFAIRVWLDALDGYDLDRVEQAFTQHLTDPDAGRWLPKPADIAGRLKDDDGRPGADEAWAIALRGKSETATVVWTDEIAAAWGAALPVMQAGDEVGARMAFREVYVRSVATARSMKQPAQWRVSFGTDPEGRERAVHEAALLGRVDPVKALPSPVAAIAYDAQMPEAVRLKLEELKASVVNREEPNNDAERARTAALKAEAARAVQQYAGS